MQLPEKDMKGAKKVKNKQVLITGSSFGIGKSLAKTFAKNGYNILLTYKTSKNESLKLKEYLEKEYKVNCESIYLDVTKERSIKKLYKQILNKYTNIDVLINNAALDIYSSFEEKNKKDFMKILDTNLIGPFLMIKYYEQYKNNGTIINISSTDGIDTNNFNRLEYCASKAGLINMTNSLSMKLKNKIISISPNWVKTESVLEMNELELKEELKKIKQNNLIEPEELSEIIYKTIENKKIKTGTNIIVKDGYHE